MLDRIINTSHIIPDDSVKLNKAFLPNEKHLVILSLTEYKA